MLNVNEMKKGLVTEAGLKSFKEKISQLQADKLYEDGLIQKKSLTPLEDDRGIFEAFFRSRVANQQIKALKGANFETFTTVMALHSFGAGMLVTFRQRELGKLLDEFTEAEADGLRHLLMQQDPYMMVCQILDAMPGSEDKKYLDSIATYTLGEATEKLSDDRYLREFAQAMFDTGLTMASA